MSVAFLSQPEITRSKNINDALNPFLALSSTNLEDDLNYIRSAIRKLHGGSSWRDVPEVNLSDLTTYKSLLDPNDENMVVWSRVKATSSDLINTLGFTPTSDAEVSALRAWKELLDPEGDGVIARSQILLQKSDIEQLFFPQTLITNNDLTPVQTNISLLQNWQGLLDPDLDGIITWNNLSVQAQNITDLLGYVPVSPTVTNALDTRVTSLEDWKNNDISTWRLLLDPDLDGSIAWSQVEVTYSDLVGILGGSPLVRSGGTDNVLGNVTATGEWQFQNSVQFTSTVNFTTYTHSVSTATLSASPHTLLVGSAQIHVLTLSENITFDFLNPPSNFYRMTLFLIQDSTGGRTVTWPPSVRWEGGTAPTLSSGSDAVDVLEFFTHDTGTTWYGRVIGLNFQAPVT